MRLTRCSDQIHVSSQCMKLIEVNDLDVCESHRMKNLRKNAQMKPKDEHFSCPFGGTQHCLIIKVLRQLGIKLDGATTDFHVERLEKCCPGTSYEEAWGKMDAERYQ